MPNKNRFFEYHHKIRWARYMDTQLSKLAMSPTRCAHLVGETSYRVGQWLKAERGVSAARSWDVGEALCSAGAATSGVEALWAAGYFDDIALLFGYIAGFAKIADRGIVSSLYVALPNVMLTFEANLAETIGFPRGKADMNVLRRHDQARIVAHISEYSNFQIGEDPTEGAWWGADDRNPWEFSNNVLRDEKTRHALQQAWSAIIRGQPIPESPIEYDFTGDRDLLDGIVNVARGWMATKFPTAVSVSVWRLLSQFVYEIDEASHYFWLVPIHYLPVNVCNQIEFEDEVKMSDRFWAEEKARAKAAKRKRKARK